MRTFNTSVRMPKRSRSSRFSGPLAKRTKYGMGNPRRLAPRNQFINQLGGWATNSRTSQKTFHLQVNTTTQNIAGTISSGTSTTFGALIITGAHIDFPDSIGAFQRLRVKKATIFVQISPGTNTTAVGTYQLCVGKDKRGNVDDPRNVAGAQSKLVTLSTTAAQGDTQIDVMRCSVMYPSILYLVDTTAANALSVAQPGWVRTNQIGSIQWQAFNYSLNTGIRPAADSTFDVNYYFNLELELREPNFS